MVHRIAALSMILVFGLLAALVPADSLAFQPGGTPPIFYQSPASFSAPASAATHSQRLAVMIELAEPIPPGALVAADPAARRQQLTVQHALIGQRLADLKVPVLFQTRLAYNGIAVEASVDQLAALRLLPGVVAVHVIPPKQRSNASAVPFVGAPAVWSVRRGVTGAGIRIGIIDSGIDYTHADFGGPGTTQAYTTNNRTLIEPGSFPTAKVIGGYDFAGDSYDASGAGGSTIPAPDLDPLDCNGHGTHVAGTAAGFGVMADGSTYRGPYVDGLDFASFRVGPGVAPDAQLYALKVFGCQGSTALITQAIERALDPNGDGDSSDHLDVINISLGAPFGSDDDPDAVALNNAVRAGVVAVVAAGDTGDTFYATDAPASAQLAIAVGASIDPARATALAPADSLAPFSSRGPQRGNHALKPDLSAPGLDIRSAAYGSGNGVSSMSGTSTAAPQVAGAAALLRQLHPHWRPEQIKAALMNSAAPLRMADGTPYPPSLGGAGRLDMTRFDQLDMLAYADDVSDTIALMYGAPWLAHPTTIARRLRVDNQTETPRSVTLSATTTVTESGVTVELPSGPISVPAHGHITVPVSITVDPAALDFTPDAATPLTQDELLRYFLAEHGGYVEVNSGANVRARAAHAAHFGDVDLYLDQQLLDDSLDSREVAGYRDATPGTHTVRVLRPGAVPTATPLVTAQVQLQQGHDYTLIMVGRPGALGIVAVDETAPTPPAGQALLHFVNANRSESNWNIGPLDVYLDGALKTPALAVGQTSAYMPVSPGAHTALFVHSGDDPTRRWVARRVFVASAGQLLLVGTGRHDDDDGDVKDDEQRAFIGYGLPRSDSALQVPFVIFPKSASDAHAASPSVNVPPSAQTFAALVSNTGARNAGLTGSVAGPQTPLASAYELAASSPPISGVSGSLSAADVRYVGVTSSIAAVTNIVDSTIFFGIASYAPWSTPNEIEFRVYIDSNLDGIDDYVILNTNWGGFVSTPSDVFISPIYKILPDGSLEAATFTFWGSLPPPTSIYGFDVTPFNTSVMFQTVSARLLGLTPGQTRFRYHVETLARDADYFGRVVDRVPAAGTLEYDLAHPAIAPINLDTPILTQRPVFLDVDGGRIGGAVFPATLAARGSQQMLVFHHHNSPPAQAELVEIRPGMPAPSQGPSNFRAFFPMLEGRR